MSNEPQNSIPEENSIPPSPQEPIVDIPVSTPDSILTDVPPEVSETPTNTDISVPLNNANTENEPIPTSSPEIIIPVESTDIPTNPSSNEVNNLPTEKNTEPVSEPVQAIQSSNSIPSNSSEQASPPQTTAQIPPNEPLTPEPETKIEPNIQEVKSTESINIQTDKPEPASVSNSGGASEAKPEPKLEKVISVPVIVSNKNKIFELLAKAKNAIQFRKRKKLDKVMSLFLKKSKITNDEVEKFLHISDATATRYLSQLKKEGQIKQNGKTGKSVFYSKI